MPIFYNLISMKTAVIIPFFNQRKYWLKMFNAIEAQSELPDLVYVAMDRQAQDDIDFVRRVCSSGKITYKVMDLHDIPDYVGKPQMIPDQSLFLTGYRRNQCIDDAIKNGIEIFIMFDGDCIPDKDVVKDHKEMNSKGLPNISNGRRREEKYNNKDQREVDPKMRAADLFNRGNGYVIHNPDLLRSCSVTWSCNLSMNLDAIKLIKKLNLLYYNRDEVFNAEFLGRWGGEDSFIGIQAIICKIYITIINTEFSGVNHMEHPRPDEKYSDKAFGDHLLREIDYLNLIQEIHSINLDFYKL